MCEGMSAGVARTKRGREQSKFGRMFFAMHRIVKIVISLSAGLALGIGLLPSLAAHAMEMASMTAPAPWAVSLESLGAQGMGDCTPHPESSTAACEQQSLCTARCGWPAVATASGQEAYISYPPSFWASIPDSRDGLLPGPNWESRVAGRELSILFCSFQN